MAICLVLKRLSGFSGVAWRAEMDFESAASGNSELHDLGCERRDAKRDIAIGRQRPGGRLNIASKRLP
jgi:hypothetical protein